jgi:signal peptidase
MQLSAKGALALLSGLALVTAGGVLLARSAPRHKAPASDRRPVTDSPTLPDIARPADVPSRGQPGRTRRLVGMVVRGALVTAVLGLVAILAPLLMGWQVYVVEGASMEPSIPMGSIITVRPAVHGELQTGDVITFVDLAHRQARITHRVTEVAALDDRPTIRTRGDANLVEDVWQVPSDQPLGKVVYFVPVVGYLVFYLGTTQAKVALLAAIALLLIYQMATGRTAKPAANRSLASAHAS